MNDSADNDAACPRYAGVRPGPCVYCRCPHEAHVPSAPRGVIKVRHRLNAAQAAMIRDELTELWPGWDIEVSLSRQWWRPWRRGLGVKVIASAEPQL